MNRRKLKHQRREGTAVAEMAICLPILLTLTIATVDVCSAMFLKESVAIAAYEGARVGCIRGGTDAAAKARVEEILTERGITYTPSSCCTITPKSFETAGTLEHVKVLVSVPASSNIVSPANLFTTGTIESFVWIRKEYKNLD